MSYTHFIEHKEILNILEVADWTKVRCTLVLTNGYARFSSTAADPYVYKDITPSIKGWEHRFISIRYKVISGAPANGQIFYTTAGHGYSASYYKLIPALTADGQWHTTVLDMSDLTAGGDDWITNEITGIRIDLTDTHPVVIDLYWIGFLIQVYPSGDWEIKHEFPTGCIFSRRIFSGELTFGNILFNGSNDYDYIMGIVDCQRLPYVIKCNDVTWWEGYINHTIGYKIDEDNCTLETTPLLSDEYDCFITYGDIEYSWGLLSAFINAIIYDDDGGGGPYDLIAECNMYRLSLVIDEFINVFINADTVCGFAGDIVSSFFWLDDYPDTTVNAVNYITGANYWEDIGIQKLQKVRSELGSAVALTTTYLTFNKLMSFLRDTFNVYWYIDINGDFRIEHLHFFEHDFADRDHTLLPDDIDITALLDKFTGRALGYGKNKWDYLSDIPSQEILTLMDAVTEDFVGLPIFYDIECTYNWPQITIKNIDHPDLFTDLPMIVADPDSVTAEGFFICAMKYELRCIDYSRITGWPTDAGYDIFSYSGDAITQAVNAAGAAYGRSNSIGAVSIGQTWRACISDYTNLGGEHPVMKIVNAAGAVLSSAQTINADGIYDFVVSTANANGYLNVQNTDACDWLFGECLLVKMEWIVQWDTGAISAALQNNGHLSTANLMDNYWRHGRVLIDGIMNGNVEVFDSIVPNRHQIPISIPKCCDILHWNTYIVTGLGDGKIYRLTEKKDTYEVELLYP